MDVIHTSYCSCSLELMILCNPWAISHASLDIFQDYNQHKSALKLKPKSLFMKSSERAQTNVHFTLKKTCMVTCFLSNTFWSTSHRCLGTWPTKPPFHPAPHSILNPGDFIPFFSKLTFYDIFINLFIHSLHKIT